MSKPQNYDKGNHHYTSEILSLIEEQDRLITRLENALFIALSELTTQNPDLALNLAEENLTRDLIIRLIDEIDLKKH